MKLNVPGPRLLAVALLLGMLSHAGPIQTFGADPCAVCQGRGQARCTYCMGQDLTKKVCTYCMGRDLTKQVCSYCMGEDLTKQQCSYCAGLGRKQGKACVMCNTTGRKKPCVMCSASGRKKPCVMCSATGKQKPCVMCKASGIRVCSECNGSGREGKKRPTPRAAPRSQSVVESKVDGEFEGWDGETIIKLMNGQIWRQTEYHYHYHYAYMPDVLIYRDGAQWKMKVEGIDKAVGVEQLK